MNTTTAKLAMENIEDLSWEEAMAQMEALKKVAAKGAMGRISEVIEEAKGYEEQARNLRQEAKKLATEAGLTAEQRKELGISAGRSGGGGKGGKPGVLQEAIVDYLRTNGPSPPKEVHEGVKQSLGSERAYATTHQALRALVAKDQLANGDGQYSLVEGEEQADATEDAETETDEAQDEEE